MAMGLLLWARLILVTGRPRTAIAVPEQAQPAGATRDGAPANRPTKPKAEPKKKPPSETDVIDQLNDDPRLWAPETIELSEPLSPIDLFDTPNQ